MSREGATLLRFFAWMAFGLVIYGVYGYRNSGLRTPGTTSPINSST